jgi:putative multiple sugar transport system permease protein
MPSTRNPDQQIETNAASSTKNTTFIDLMRNFSRQNIREYSMYLALLLIMAYFSITTNGIFLSPQNISNLLDQTGYIAVLAIGMTLVIVIRHIDMSVGFFAGFIGAITAILLVTYHLPVILVILIVLTLGLFAGLLTGFLVAGMGIPAFVATLAGMLIYRGALLLVTTRSGTIIIPNEAFNAIGNGFIPDLPQSWFLPGVHKLTLILGGLIILIMAYIQSRDRKMKQRYSIEVSPIEFFILKIVLITILVGGLTWTLAGYNGLSWTVLIVLLVMAIYQMITTRTVLGRHIYAIGSNPESAELSGISVKNLTYLVFGSMGFLAALSGILFTARLRSATTTAGTLFELDAIAAAYVGGVSATGGIGKVTGAIIGALVMTSLTSGMNLMGVDIAFQYIVRGVVLATAVIFDVTTRKRGK